MKLQFLSLSLSIFFLCGCATSEPKSALSSEDLEGFKVQIGVWEKTAYSEPVREASVTFEEQVRAGAAYREAGNIHSLCNAHFAKQRIDADAGRGTGLIRPAGQRSFVTIRQSETKSASAIKGKAASAYGY